MWAKVYSKNKVIVKKFSFVLWLTDLSFYTSFYVIVIGLEKYSFKQLLPTFVRTNAMYIFPTTFKLISRRWNGLWSFVNLWTHFVHWYKLHSCNYGFYRVIPLCQRGLKLYLYLYSNILKYSCCNFHLVIFINRPLYSPQWQSIFDTMFVKCKLLPDLQKIKDLQKLTREYVLLVIIKLN